MRASTHERATGDHQSEWARPCRHATAATALGFQGPHPVGCAMETLGEYPDVTLMSLVAAEPPEDAIKTALTWFSSLTDPLKKSAVDLFNGCVEERTRTALQPQDDCVMNPSPAAGI